MIQAVVVLLDRGETSVEVSINPQTGIVIAENLPNGTLYRREVEIIQRVMRALGPYKDSFPKPPRENRDAADSQEVDNTSAANIRVERTPSRRRSPFEAPRPGMEGTGE